MQIKNSRKKIKYLFHVHEAMIINFGLIVYFQYGVSVSAPLKICSKSISVQKINFLSQKSLFSFALWKLF